MAVHWFEQHGNNSVMRRCLNDKPDQTLRMTYKGLWPNASWLLSNLYEAQYVDWIWHPVLNLLMIFPLWGVALPFTLQMVLSMFPLTNLNTRHQRRRQQLHRRRNLLPLQLLSLVP
jgi:hypothetical protein